MCLQQRWTLWSNHVESMHILRWKWGNQKAFEALVACEISTSGAWRRVSFRFQLAHRGMPRLWEGGNDESLRATEDFKIRHFLRLSPTPLTIKMTKNAAAKTCKLTMGSSNSHTRPSASSRSGAWIGNWIPSASLQRELCNRSVNLLITGSCQKDLFIKIWERQSALTCGPL